METSILDEQLVRKLQGKKYKNSNQTIEAGTFIWDATFKCKKKMKERKKIYP